ncbi:carboxypeptidase-like regulatory domain-containing protein [Spartinivicinus poritis]|uniref:Carboxypeptidase-like regulatory domain-containing protein n=1 Tax=Spartinivicinus poritis TaxID=2994640 RepID=A0ABT5UK08_9GAMM|nr:carboxypeptidase-like regulatory domain-containing protein [Spartinivicinus sp. A2-2]MDE1465733.1 carboxypeptidase-like regulatory domain-containing protein [Spartinivicinus sp. A2-2]
MNSTLEYATTPLALASLAAILIVGLLKLLVKGKNNALNRLITHYGFGLLIFFGLTGNLIFFYESYQSSETLIIGSVVDENGRYLPRVMIDTGGHARGMTSDTGEFILAIPKSRVQDKYSVSASLLGYKSNVKVVSNKSRIFLRFQLKKSEFIPDDSISMGDNQILIGHFIGLPDIGIQIQFINQTTKQIQFKNLSVEVLSPSGKVRRLIQVSSGIDMNGPSMAIMPNIFIDPYKSAKFYFRFIQYDAYIQQLVSSIQPSLIANPNFQAHGPSVGTPYLTQEKADKITQSMEQAWFWEPGESTVRFSASVEGNFVKIERQVKLELDQINSMKKISDYYENGFGIMPQMSLMPVGDAKPGYQVSSREKI